MENKKLNKRKIYEITNLEVGVLKNRLFTSIKKEKKKKRKKYFTITAVASILIGFTLSFYNLNKPSESVIDYVKNNTETAINNKNDVLLILGNGKNVALKPDSNHISYSKNGEEVFINKKDKLEQETTKNEKTLFNTIIVPYGKRSKIILCDGTSIWLNSGSKLVYPTVFNGNKREIYLEGEAIFDVAHNKSKPFMVLSQHQEIEVLGTVFGVTDYLDESAVNTVLKSGSVQISFQSSSKNSNKDKMKITPGTMASYNKKNKSILSKKVNVDNYFSWRDGVFIFKNTPFEVVIKRVSRYYNIPVDIQNKTNNKETFSGYLNLNEDVESVIEYIKASTNMNYTFKENKITIN